MEAVKEVFKNRMVNVGKKRNIGKINAVNLMSFWGQPGRLNRRVKNAVFLLLANLSEQILLVLN